MPSGAQRQLTDGGEFADAEPTYSRDGRYIAFVRYSNDGSDIWVMNRDGRNPRPVTQTEDLDESEPAFSWSGQTFFFSRSDPSTGSGVFLVRSDGSAERQVAARAKNPTFSPDRLWLAFVRDGRIQLRDLRSGEDRQLPSGPAQEPDFSPDGKRLVFVGQRPCGAKGQKRLAILTIGVHDRRARTLFSACGTRFIPYGPVWSPRGDRVVFVRRDNPAGKAGARLQMLNLRGERVPGAPRHRRGTFEFHPTWQPIRKERPRFTAAASSPALPSAVLSPE